MSSQANTPDGALTRRRFMKIGAAGTVGAVGLGGAGDLAPSAVGESEAIAPIILYGGYVGASVAAGWLLHEGFSQAAAEDPAEGLTPDVLHNQTYDAARKRQSNNRSTFVDQQNMIASGHRHALYGDGKMAAIEALNDEESEADVLAAAKAAAREFATTVQTNFLKSWNESVRELDNMATSVVDHADLTIGDVLQRRIVEDGSRVWYGVDSRPTIEDATHTLPDGTDFTLRRVTEDSTINQVWDPTYVNNEEADDQLASALAVTHPTDGPSGPEDGSGGRVAWLAYEEWNSVWTELTGALSDVESGLDTWVTNVYADVQAGELDTADLMTSRELAAMSADEEGFNQAVADLMALNISVNLEREAEVNIPDINGTVNGQIGVTGDTTLETGTVDPSADDFDYYLTYDISQGEGTWEDYESGIDGGVVTFTAEPYEQTEFDIETNGGETVTVTADDFSDQGDGTWTADLSEQLETDIAEINSVMFYATTSETQYETVQLTDPFEIVTFRDTETDEEFDSAEHSSNEPQDDTNYISEEEWKDMEARQQELIDKYEESKNDGGGGLLPEGEGGIVGLLAIAALGGAALLGR